MTSGMMIEGKWVTAGNQSDSHGELKLIPTTFRDRVTADGASGFKAAAGRYHLYVALGCPWAHRTLVMRELKGLNEVISVSTELFESLERWETILSKQRYLCGNQLTEADICMFVTLYRFNT